MKYITDAAVPSNIIHIIKKRTALLSFLNLNNLAIEDIIKIDIKSLKYHA